VVAGVVVLATFDDLHVSQWALPGYEKLSVGGLASEDLEHPAARSL